MTKKEKELFDSAFVSVKADVGDNLDTIDYCIETNQRIVNYSVSLKDYLSGLQRFGEIDTFTDDLKKVGIYLPLPKDYDSAKDEMGGGTLVESSIDVINESIKTHSQMILKWLLRKKSKNIVF